jgi:hypothetical protein
VAPERDVPAAVKRASDGLVGAVMPKSGDLASIASPTSPAPVALGEIAIIVESEIFGYSLNKVGAWIGPIASLRRHQSAMSSVDESAA